MKKLRQLWKKIIEQHIVQVDPYLQSCILPAADANVLRAKVHRHFKYNQPDDVYIIDYDLSYHTTIDILRKEDWTITVEVDNEGKLFYTVYARWVKQGIIHR